MPQQKRPVILILLIVIVAVGFGYLIYSRMGGGKPDTQQAGTGQAPPTEVVVQVIQPADLPVSYEYAGRAAGSREVEIRPRVSGILQKREYIEGQAVKTGDVMFRIDPAPFEAALAQAQARYNQAEKDWARAQKLTRAKALSPREGDQAQSSFEQARAELQTAKINLDYTVVVAPISGVTSQESLSEGSLVVADNTLLTRLTQLDPAYIEFAYPDSDAIEQRQLLASGKMAMPADQVLQAEVRLGQEEQAANTGTVNFTDSVIDPQTGTVRARAVVPNPNGAIFPGQFVRVSVKGFVMKNAVAIPDQAVMQGPQGPFVYVVTPENKAGIAPVTLGDIQGKNRFIESGLKQGDKVIVEGMIKVRPDAPVKIAEGKADVTQAGPADKQLGAPPAATDARPAAQADEKTAPADAAPADASGQKE